MKHHRISHDARCPSCGAVSDGATQVNDEEAAPTPGDLSVCINCCAVLAFTDDLTVRLCGDDELRGLPFFIRMQLEAIRQTIARSTSYAERKH